MRRIRDISGKGSCPSSYVLPNLCPMKLVSRQGFCCCCCCCCCVFVENYFFIQYILIVFSPSSNLIQIFLHLPVLTKRGEGEDEGHGEKGGKRREGERREGGREGRRGKRAAVQSNSHYRKGVKIYWHPKKYQWRIRDI